MTWVLVLLGALLPALCLAALVGRAADRGSRRAPASPPRSRWRPGTMMLPFSTLLFSPRAQRAARLRARSGSAWNERARPTANLWRLALAGAARPGSR